MRRDDIRSTAVIGILAFALVPVLAADAGAQLLLEVDGVELHGRARLVMSGAGSCNVLETDTSYEEYKANHGAPMDVWRLDFSVRNGSGRWLDHLIARFEIDSEWPDCTNWSGPDVVQLRDLNPEVPLKDMTVAWSGSHSFIQETGRNVVAPNETLTDTEFIIVLRGDPDPRFVNWSMNFNFGSVNPPSGTPAAADAAPQAVQPATAEQETVFWQSIVNSTNAAMFEAYLAQFPNGVFRALAEARLVELRAPAGPGAGRAASPASRLRASGDRDPTSPTAASEDSASRFAADETCTGKPEGAECWMEVANQPDCYVWNTGLQPGATVTWTAECSGGVAQGRGTLTMVWDGNEQTATGRIQDGERNGHWVVRQADGIVAEGPYVDGEPNGRWVVRGADGHVEEGPFVDGERNGHWVIRGAEGNVLEGPYVDGERNGAWVIRTADGDIHEGPYVDGKMHGTWVARDADGTIFSKTRHENGRRVRGLNQGPACIRQRLIGLGVLNSSIRPATIQFTGSRMVIVQSSGAASTRQESEYSVTADTLTYRIVRATGTAPGSGSRDIPIINAGPHTVACSLSGGVLSFGDGTWR